MKGKKHHIQPQRGHAAFHFFVQFEYQTKVNNPKAMALAETDQPIKKKGEQFKASGRPWSNTQLTDGLWSPCHLRRVTDLFHPKVPTIFA